ncbi:MAG: hypothetical protein CMJ18_22605 [Phycisphaeraceae bacterium]|nr:hypothetical protein [Phycisphaeraceae bacterium]
MVRYAAIVLVTVTLGLATWAGPVFPARTVRSNQVRSLADLSMIRIAVRPLPEVLRRAGLSVDAIRSQWSEALQQAGFDVSDEALALLELRLVTMQDPNDPDNFAINPVLMLYQNARVRRRPGELVIPTYVNIRIGIERRDGIANPVRRVLQAMRGQFIQDCRRANEK